MFAKLVVLFPGEYDERINKLLGLDKIAIQGINIEYWNIQAISFNDNVNHTIIPNGIKYVVIKDDDDFKNRIVSNNKDNTLYYIHTLYFRWTYQVYRIISKYKCHWMTTVIGRQPRVEQNYKKKFKTLSFSKVYLFFVNRFYRFLKRTPLISKADFCFYSGSELVLYPGNVCGKKTEYHRINTTDYQSYINIVNSNFSLSEITDKIVFIDQYIPLHPDNKIIGYKFDSDSYYQEMNEIFDELENKYKTSVIIAAHPASLEYKKHNYFNGRKVYYGNTEKMVMHAKCVVVHHSTAVAFPVLSNKPIIIAYSPQFDGKAMGRTCYLYQEYLNCYLIDRNSVKSLPVNLAIDKDAYNKYKYAFLTSKETEGKSNDTILLKILQGNE